MSRQAEQYEKMAANYDRMALAINDQALRWIYLDFAKQWREVAHQAEIVESRALLGDQHCAVQPFGSFSRSSSLRVPVSSQQMYRRTLMSG